MDVRQVKYLSPTSVTMFFKDRELFYTTYLAKHRPPREPQTQAMSVGSAFDARVKARLASVYLGKDEEAEYESLFESQVEAHNKDWAATAGLYAWEEYVSSGAFNDLMEMLKGRKAEPHMEADVYGEVDGIPLRGKPDLYFTLRSGRFVILDWKVNGFCSNWPKSPEKGYVMLRYARKFADFSRATGHGTSHKDSVLERIDGIVCNIFQGLDTVNMTWALQLSTYSWLVGNPVGSAFIACIDQLACDNKKMPGIPLIRVAEHRCLIAQGFQAASLKKYQECFAACNSEHYFPEMTLADSQARCAILDDLYKNYDPKDPAFIELTQDLWKNQRMW